MTYPEIEVYVVGLETSGGLEFCRFGSYSEATLVDHPLKATIYRRRIDAEKRANEEHWIDGNCVKARHFYVVTVTATAKA